MILDILLLLPVLCYAWCLLRCRASWQSIPAVAEEGEVPTVFFSVILPVRNEASTILSLLRDLEQQHYPKECYEVLVVDDHSTDRTPELVQEFQAQSALNLRLLFLASFPEKRLKKAAVEVGITAAQGEWIACTDGDCRLGPRWLTSINQLRHARQPVFISGPVVLSPASSVFEKLQALEFAVLIGVGAATLRAGRPTMCNGANIAYEKAAFLAVNGFAGNDQIPSGDDEFLLHKIQAKFPGQVAFLKEEQAIVRTPAAASLSQFLRQRVRWASKWRHYEVILPKLLAVLVLGANLALWVAFFSALADGGNWWFFLLLLALKLLPDLWFFAVVLPFFQKKRLFSLVPLLQVLYVPYVLLVALLGLRGNYQWKGRYHTKP